MGECPATGDGGNEFESFALDLNRFQDSVRKASTLLKAMSNEHRLMILCQLTKGEKCVSELESIIGLSQSALSQHLARLRRDEVVKTRRSAQTIFYSLAGPEARAVIETLYDFYCSAEDQSAVEEPRAINL